MPGGRKSIRKRLKQDILKCLRLHQATLVSYEVRRGRYTLIRLAIDHPYGVDIRLCQKVTRSLQDKLAWFEQAVGPFQLEVSSPGIERELKKPREFRWAIGRTVRVLCREPVEGQTDLRGQLEHADAGGIRLSLLPSSSSLFLPWSSVARVKLDPGPA